MAHYCIVRKDLPLGVLGAQLIHAAGESSTGDLPECVAAVCLAVPDEQGLLGVAEILQKAEIPYRAIREDVGPFAGQLMAIGVRPMSKDVVRKHLSSLPLLK